MLDLQSLLDRLGPRPEIRNTRLVDLHCIQGGSLLCNHQSPTGKEYQGWVALGASRETGQAAWLGVCVYGPGGNVDRNFNIVYDGISLEAACQAVNSRINQKLGRGYDPERCGVFVEPSNVLDILRDRAGELPQLEMATTTASSALARVLDQG